LRLSHRAPFTPPSLTPQYRVFLFFISYGMRQCGFLQNLLSLPSHSHVIGLLLSGFQMCLWPGK
jgi:hypothetical protein